MTIWFTSDTHFWHKNIIEFCNRPSENVEQMNELLIQRWNEKVSETDDIYHLGDFFWCGYTKAREILDRLNGIKYWIRGNHDKIGLLEDQFVWVKDYYELKVHDKFEDADGKILQYHQGIVLMHFPILSWNRMQHGYWHLHGHTHGSMDNTWNKTGFRMDVGVDTNNLYPYSYEEIKNRMIMRSVVPVESAHVPK